MDPDKWTWSLRCCLALVVFVGLVAAVLAVSFVASAGSVALKIAAGAVFGYGVVLFFVWLVT